MSDPRVSHVELQLTEEAIASLAGAVDNALEITAAQDVARRSGRMRGLHRLKGERVMRSALSRASGAKQRDIDVVITRPDKKKRQRPPRPGRPTGWPSLKHDRERVAARALELQAFPERRMNAPLASQEEVHLAASGNPYVPRCGGQKASASPLVSQATA